MIKFKRPKSFFEFIKLIGKIVGVVFLIYVAVVIIFVIGVGLFANGSSLWQAMMGI